MGRVQAPAASLPPLWWAREFRGEPELVGRARAWLAGLLPACEPLDDLLFFTGELAANAVTHTRSGRPGGHFTIEVTWSPQAARVIIGDQGSDEVPVLPAGTGDMSVYLESGRGLLTIEAMSAAWGIAGDATGRWLWAEVHWRAAGGAVPTAPSGDGDAARRLEALHLAYPGATPHYRPQSGDWRATIPEAREPGGIVSAPSPFALAGMLAARYPAASGGAVGRMRPDPASAHRGPAPARAAATGPGRWRVTWRIVRGTARTMREDRMYRDYPSATLGAFHAAVTALLGYEDMLPTDLSVKLGILRDDIARAATARGSGARAISPTSRRPATAALGPATRAASPTPAALRPASTATPAGADTSPTPAATAGSLPIRPTRDPGATAARHDHPIPGRHPR